ncbi:MULTISPECIES: hypothetical protein [Cysteiniphilum]|nr:MULTISPECIES: hypothetical protein [Cysteiniphilum]
MRVSKLLCIFVGFVGVCSSNYVIGDVALNSESDYTVCIQAIKDAPYPQAYTVVVHPLSESSCIYSPYSTIPQSNHVVKHIVFKDKSAGNLKCAYIGRSYFDCDTAYFRLSLLVDNDPSKSREISLTNAHTDQYTSHTRGEPKYYFIGLSDKNTSLNYLQISKSLTLSHETAEIGGIDNNMLDHKYGGIDVLFSPDGTFT